MSSNLYVNFHVNSLGGGTPYAIFVFGDPGELITVENNAGFFEQFNLDANGFGSLSLPNSVAMSGTGISDQGLRISAAGDISASLVNRAQFTTDLSIIFEEASLGQNYVLASFNDNIGEGGQFSVQAIVDNTEVTYTLPDGQSGTVTLNAGETFKFAAAVGDPSNGVVTNVSTDLTGTIINATADVAVFSGHDCTDVPLSAAACDHIVEQMPAIENLSTEYVVGEAFNSGQGPNLVRVIAATDGTEVTVDGSVVATLQAGEFHEFLTSGPAAVIQTSSPALVAQYLTGSTLAGEGDPAMSFVPGTDTWLSEYEFASPTGSEAFTDNLINVVIPTSAIASLEVNGAPVDPSEFTPIAGTDFSVANLSVPAGVNSASADEPFQLSLFGYESFDSYLTFGGATFASGTVNVPPDAVADAYTVTENQQLADNVLDNDSDPDGDPLEVSLVDDVDNGTLVLNQDGSFTYTPDPDFVGQDEFVYQVSDPEGATDTATVTITVEEDTVTPPPVDGIELFVGKDAEFDVDLSFDTDVAYTSNLSVESAYDVDVAIEGNEAVFNVDVQAFGDDTSTALDLVSVTNDEWSSILATGYSSVDGFA